LPWYSKIDESVHLLGKKEWERFDNDSLFRAEVLRSNQYDARAAYELANQLQNDFQSVFGWFPSSLISPGSFTRAAYQAVTYNRYKYLDNEERKKAVKDELQSIGIASHFGEWQKQLDSLRFNDFLCLASECYKGAKIECIGSVRSKRHTWRTSRRLMPILRRCCKISVDRILFTEPAFRNARQTV
jgi:hypothetical protein